MWKWCEDHFVLLASLDSSSFIPVSWVNVKMSYEIKHDYLAPVVSVWPQVLDSEWQTLVTRLLAQVTKMRFNHMAAWREELSDPSGQWSHRVRIPLKQLAWLGENPKEQHLPSGPEVSHHLPTLISPFCTAIPPRLSGEQMDGLMEDWNIDHIPKQRFECSFVSNRKLLSLVIKKMPGGYINSICECWQSFVWIHQFSRYTMSPVIEYPLNVFYDCVSLKRPWFSSVEYLLQCDLMQ